MKTKYNIKIFLVLFLCLKLNAQKESESKDKEISIQEPKLVVPGRFLSPPSDAIVLFDGKDFTKWQHALPNLFFTMTTIVINFFFSFYVIECF